VCVVRTMLEAVFAWKRQCEAIAFHSQL
jgi:hypothetical protein